MKALLWKEWRETLPVMLIGLCLLGMSAALTLMQMSREGDSELYDAKWLNWLTFGTPCYGLAIGAVQGFAERERDLWAFLIHRPIGRGVMVAAKLGAGLLAYVTVPALVYVMSVHWAVTPGNLPAPYNIHFAEPAVVDILVGAVFYFAALLTVFPSTRLPMRIMPLVAAAAVTYVVTFTDELWVALTWSTIAIAIGLVSTCGRFRTDGMFENERRPSERIAAVLILLLGFCVPLAMLIWCTDGFVTPHIDYPHFKPSPENYWQFTADGRLAVVHFSSDRNITVRDKRTGKTLPSSSIDGLVGSATYSEIDLDTFDADSSTHIGGYKDPNHWLRPVVGFYGSVYWYYDTTTHYFMGYSMKSKQLTEMLGSQGFCVPGSGPEPRAFAGEPEQVGSFVLQDGKMPAVFTGGYYVIDFGARTVTNVTTADTKGYVDAVAFRPTLAEGDAQNNLPTYFAFRSLHSVSVYENEYHQFTVEPNFPLGYSPDVQFLCKAKRFILWYHAPRDKHRTSTVRPPSYVVEVNHDGVVNAAYYLPSLSRAARPWHYYDRMPAYPYVILGAISPFIFVVDAARDPNDGLGSGTFDDAYEQLAPLASWDSKSFRTLVIASGAAGLFWAAVVFWLGKRFRLSQSPRLAWAVATIGLGIPALAAMACMAGSAQSVRCESCGKHRPLSLIRCPQCGADFARPERQTTDIFENAGDPGEALS